MVDHITMSGILLTGSVSSSVTAPLKRVTLLPPGTSHINFTWFLSNGGWHGSFSLEEMLTGPGLCRSCAGRHSFISSQFDQPCLIKKTSLPSTLPQCLALASSLSHFLQWSPGLEKGLHGLCLRTSQVLSSAFISCKSLN